MSTTTCLQRIEEIRKYDLSGFEKRVKDEFKGSSVIANWGKRNAYIVNDVVFDRNPHTSLFEYNGAKISVADYFSKLY
jgi:hypothetical protein